MIHLLKVKEIFFDLLKTKSYLSRLEDIAHATSVDPLFTTFLILLKAFEQQISTKLLSRTTPSITKLGTNSL